jgi:hypothetical protein
MLRGAQQPAQAEPHWGFGAIVYSPSTGAYGWASNQEWRYRAADLAVTRCQQSAWRGRAWADGAITDVAVVAWGRNTTLALAVDGWGGHGVGWDKAARRRGVRPSGRARQGTIVVTLWCGSPEPARQDRFYGMGGTTGELPDPGELRDSPYEIGSWQRCGICGRPQCPEHSPGNR